MRLPLGFAVHPMAQAPLDVGAVPCLTVGWQPSCGSDAVPAAPGEPVKAGEPPLIPGAKLIRCKTCKAYINPFVQWQNCGRRWGCSLCGTASGVPSMYFATTVGGRRVDEASRPELTHGAVEYLIREVPGAGKSLPLGGSGHGGRHSQPQKQPQQRTVQILGSSATTTPTPPSVLFLIEASRAAVDSGLTQAAAAAVSEAVSSHKAALSKMRMSLMTFDSSLQFFQLAQLRPLAREAGMAAAAAAPQPRAVVLSDIDEVYLPLPMCAMEDSTQDREALLAALDALPAMAHASAAAGSCVGVALKAAMQAFGPNGGKIVAFVTGPPSLGEFANPRGCLAAAESAAAREAAARRAGPEAPLTKLATALAEAKVCVDLFVASPHGQFADVAGLSPLTRLTGGDLHFLPAFAAERDGPRLRSAIARTMLRRQGRSAELRLRVSRGWRVTKVHGHFLHKRVNHLLLANCHEDQAFLVSVEHEDVPPPSKDKRASSFQQGSTERPMVMQAALSFTDDDGLRRVRVYTWAAASCARTVAEALPSLDCPVAAALLAARAMDDGDATDLPTARTRLQTECQQISLACGTANQEVLSGVISSALGLLKSAALRVSVGDVRHDLRASIWCRLEALPLDQFEVFLQPRLLPVLATAATASQGDEELRWLPRSLPLSAASLSSGEVYFLDDGERLSAWIGRDVPLDTWALWQLLTGACAHHPGPWAEASASVARALTSGQRYGAVLQLGALVRQGEAGEDAFLRRLTQDPGPGNMPSLAQWARSLRLPTAPPCLT